jgi:hypothetical protein
MKKLFLLSLFTVISVMSNTCWAGMSNSRVRKEALYLSDKMAYELGLSNSQYEDIYEINFDFIYSLRNTLDYVVDGYEWAIEDYYDALDLRNDDLRYVLSNSQYRRFMNLEYFYRPIYVSTSKWYFRIYNVYTNHSLFYMSKPKVYRSYNGGHYRESMNSTSHYKNKYTHSTYTGSSKIRGTETYQSNRRSDFGSVNIRQNTSRSDVKGNSSNGNKNTSTSGKSIFKNSNSVNNGSSSSSNRVNSGSSSNRVSSSSNVTRPSSTTNSNSSSVNTNRNTENVTRPSGTSSNSSSRRSSSVDSGSSSNRGSSSSINRSSSSGRSSSTTSGSSSSSSRGSRSGRSGR